jgi:hypothetical protein
MNVYVLQIVLTFVIIRPTWYTMNYVGHELMSPIMHVRGPWACIISRQYDFDMSV